MSDFQIFSWNGKKILVLKFEIRFFFLRCNFIFVFDYFFSIIHQRLVRFFLGIQDLKYNIYEHTHFRFGYKYCIDYLIRWKTCTRSKGWLCIQHIMAMSKHDIEMRIRWTLEIKRGLSFTCCFPTICQNSKNVTCSCLFENE